MRIFKGDDTGGTLGKRLVINVHSKYDLTGCLVIFNYQGVTRKWENVHDGDRLEIFFSHNETMKMSVGTFKGVLFTVDASGKYRTINHAVPIEVTTDLKACYGADELDATVGQAIDWDNVINKPFEGVEVDLSTDDKKLAALGTIIEKLGGTVKTLALFALSALAGLSGLAYEPEANTNSFTRSGVTYAQRGGLGNSSYVVTNVQMSAGDVGAVPDDEAYAAATNRALTVSGASRPLPPYLHVIDFADSYTNELAILPSFLFGGCSSFRNGNWYGRTYDWKYTHAPSFVVRMSANEDRFASVGVASFGDLLKEDDIALGRFSPLFKALPCMTLDGINSEGVFANINVVATNGNDAAYFTGDYPALACVRYVLDHFANALDAAVWVAANAKIPQAALDAGYSFHWMIGDETSTFVVEDGDWFPAFENAMTNFRIIQPNEPYGSGHERYETIRGAVATNADPKAICKAVWFREAYRRPFMRPTEFAGSEDGSGRIPYTATERLLAWAEANVPQGAPESLERNGRSWQSVHSSVYDIRNRQLSVAVQETDDWYTFAVPSAGAVKPEAVREIVEPMIGAATNGLRRVEDMAVYEVVRTENTDWTWTSEPNDDTINALLVGKKTTTDETRCWYWPFVPLPEGYYILQPIVYGIDPDATEVSGFSLRRESDGAEVVFTATRPRYMDESIEPKDDQQLAAVATDNASKPANGDLVKYDAANDRFVKAIAGTDYADEAAWTSRQIVRGEKISDEIWGITVNKADSAGYAHAVTSEYWEGDQHPTTLIGYGITDARGREDNTCHKTEFGEWTAGEGAPEGINGQPSHVTVDGYTHWTWDFAVGDAPMRIFIFSATAGDGDLDAVELTFEGGEVGEEARYTFTATRSVVCTSNETFVTTSYVTNAVSSAISTNNQAFVSAVRNTPTSGIPEDIPTDWGTYGTVGAALAALAAFVKWAKAKIVAVIGDDGKPTDTFAADILSKQVANAKVRYKLSTVSSTTMSDRTTNFLQMNGNATLTFPEAIVIDGEKYSRDFLLRVKVTTAGSLTLPADIALAPYSDDFDFTKANDWLIAFTEEGVDANGKAEFYIRAIC